MANVPQQSAHDTAIARAESEISAEHAVLLNEFERFIHRDPARRGLCAAEVDETEQAAVPRLGAGQLAAAALNLARHARKVAIVTGFFIPHAQPSAAETDGPPGSLLLAHCLQALGIEAVVITDAPCAPAVRAAADGIDFSVDRVLVSPLEAESWCNDFWTLEFASGLTHLISIERVGPSHTPVSIKHQGSASDLRGISNLKSEISNLKSEISILDSFLADVAPEHHDHCHNMRGVCIDGHTAPLHLLFERLPSRHPSARTIGIGDGGNEIGMGAIPWSELRRRLPGEQAGRVPCRVACDFNIVAGTSNWGAMALAAGVCLLRNRLDVLRPWTRERHREWLEYLVANGPAVDGVTGRREATVDGLPFLTYIQPWEGILRRSGFPA